MFMEHGIMTFISRNNYSLFTIAICQHNEGFIKQMVSYLTRMKFHKFYHGDDHISDNNVS